MAAFLEYNEVLKAIDPAGFYDSYSTACRDRYTRTDFSTFLIALHAETETFYGLTVDQLSWGEPTIVRAGASADLTYEVLDPDGKPIQDEPSEATWVFENGRWFRDTCEFDDLLNSTPATSNAASDNDASGPGSRNTPIPIGEAADVGNGWTLKINSVEIDGTATVLAANQFNDPPPEGKQYVLINATMRYDGPDESSTDGVLIKTLGEATNQPVSDFDSNSFATPPEPSLDAGGTELFQGGEATGNVVIEIDSADAPTLLILGSAFYSGNSDRKFFATS